MAPRFPEEVDVFTVPHNRMKALVQRYHESLTSTNFSSPCELTMLLQQLSTTFREFKVHETIENTFIMQKLKVKLQQLSITNNVVCNCHKDHKLTQMLHLLEDGHKKCGKSDQDRVNYGIQLRMALDDFTEQFIPHMQEEEEVLQPLLVEHFSYEELKEIKTQVIHQHTQLECFKDSPEKFYTDELFDSVLRETKDKEEVDETCCDEYTLPDEVWLQVFSFLNPLELTKCAAVSKRWKRIALDPSLWTSIYPVAWSKGLWDLNSVDLMLCEEGNTVVASNVCLGKYIEIDEDADIDESSDGIGDYYLASRQREIEMRMLKLMIKQFLACIGRGVQKVYLMNSRVLTDELLYDLLSKCPNIEHLDISQTQISDKAFRSLGKNGIGQKLRHLNFAGCTNITDKTLHKVSEALARPILNQSSCTSQLDSPLELETCSYTCNTVHEKYTLMSSGKSEGMLLPSCCIGCPYLSGPQCTLNTNGCGRFKFKHNLRKFSRTTYLTTKVEEDSSSGCDNMSGCYSLHSDRTLMSDTPGCPSSDNEVKNHREPQWNSSLRNNSLEYLNLSGCFRITDVGLRSLSRFGGLPHLVYLDLSGCMKISGAGIRQLVERCPNLEHTFLFYCDNISDDPYECTASGCQNLQCTSRVCCRSGE